MGILTFFSCLYDKTLLWSGHRHAKYYLAGISFAESSFFPIPPDVMLISMGLAKPQKSWHFAFITTVFSVLGGIFGYLIGVYGMALLEPWFTSSYQANYEQIIAWFKHYGVWIVFIAASFSPIPYKLFTITAGALHMAFWPFVVASLLGRGTRFFLVSTILYFVGERLEHYLREWINSLGWIALLVLMTAYLLYNLFS